MNKHIEESLYRKIIEKLPVVSVDILIFSEDLKRVLLLRRKNEPAGGEFYSPGGRLLKNELPKDCAKRKLKKEVGISANNEMRFAGTISEFFPNSYFSSKISSHFFNVFYCLVYDGDGNFNLDSQHLIYKWVNINDNNIQKYVKIKIRESLKQIKNEKNR